jgi:lipopolysaccharide/colanic/teichoic acid biosynthesis glycosyltransferase
MALQGDSSIDRESAANALHQGVSRFPLPQWSRRVCDIVAASTGLVLLSPILLITALAIKLGSRGPIFVHETLLGPDNQATKVLKFRLVEASSGNRNHARLTPIARIVGDSGIDELPRLFNVVRGNLSIVGRQNVPRWPDTALGVDLTRRID